jgi:vacuolar protein sorting-associated protein VTA1
LYRNTIKAFYTSSLLVDVLENFGEVSEEFDRMRKYGKWKAAYVHNCLKRGELPKAGPVGDEYGEYDDNQQDNAIPTVVIQPEEIIIPVVIPFQAPIPAIPQNAAATHSIETLQQAQKYTKFASSALVFDDVPTAIENLRKALSILENN